MDRLPCRFPAPAVFLAVTLFGILPFVCVVRCVRSNSHKKQMTACDLLGSQGCWRRNVPLIICHVAFPLRMSLNSPVDYILSFVRVVGYRYVFMGYKQLDMPNGMPLKLLGIGMCHGSLPCRFPALADMRVFTLGLIQLFVVHKD